MAEHTILCTSSVLDAKERWERLFRYKSCHIIYSSLLDLSLHDLEKMDIDAIVVEAHLHSVEALELIGRLRQQTHYPILFMTADTDERYYVKAYRAGADECISTRISNELMLAKVRAWLRWTGRAPACGNSTQAAQHRTQALVTSQENTP
jgi:DNA-binding response OmpR family regulator